MSLTTHMYVKMYFVLSSELECGVHQPAKINGINLGVYFIA